MRFIYGFVLTILTTAVLNGQNFKISGIVVDATNREKLPFANIMVIGYPIGTTTDRDGLFELSLDSSLKNESIVISYVGYQASQLVINENLYYTIELQPLKIALNEVVIKAQNKKKKPVIINQFKQQDCIVRYSPTNIDNKYFIPTRPKEPTIEALYFPSMDGSVRNIKVKEVWLQVTNFKSSNSYFNVRIFGANDKHLPSEDLVNENIIVEVSDKEQLIKVNLEKYNIIMPGNGIFVGFELLIINDNMSIAKVSESLKFTLYSPYLNFLRCKEEQKFWLYSKGEWIEASQETPHFTKKNVVLFYKPAISLILED